MSVLFWFAGIVSSLGAAVTIACLVIVPTTTIQIIQAVVAGILKCKPCLYALIVAALCAGSFWYGHHKASADCRAGELAAKLAAQHADLEAAKKSAADATDRAKTIEDNASERQQKDSDYIAKLQANPACALTDGDLGGSWLRDHANKWRFKKSAPSSK